MYRRALFIVLLFISSLIVQAAAADATVIAWDHPAPTTVTGYRVSVDGVSTDYGLSVSGAGNTCGCTLTLTLAPGTHTLVVSAYNAAGQTPSAPLTVDIPNPSTPPPPPPAVTLPAPWLTQDIGSTGATGSATISNGSYTVAGSGADIWGTADSFRYLYQPLTGDGTVVARVTGMQNTNTFAKAGVMIRETTGGNASHALLNLRPNGTLELLARNGSGASTSFLGTTTQAAPVWVKLSRNGDTITAAMSRDGSAWTTVGTATVRMGANVLVGLAVCSVAPGTLNTATFDSVTVTTGSTTTTPPPPPPPPVGTGSAVPSPWTSNDVGSTGLTGSATYSNGTFTVAGAGADVWGTADAFQYVSQPSSGDGTWTARVVSLENTSRFAKAGLMLRGSLDASAQDVVLDVTPNGGIEFMGRTSAGSTTTYVASAGQTPPAWLRLARSGNRVTASVSANGTAWTTVGSLDVAGLTVGGLFVNSHDVTVRNTAVFDNVTAPASGGGGTGGGGSTTIPEIVIYAADVPATALHGSFTKEASASAAANVKLQTTDVGYTTSANALASPQHYVDINFNASAGVAYTFWLRLRATGNSKYNDSVWVQFSNARVNGSPVYGIGSTSGLLVNLATDSTGASLQDWGWQNSAYWFSQPATLTFATSGAQTLRLQVREDGIQIDQVVLSSSRYLTQRPGAVAGDTTIVAK